MREEQNKTLIREFIETWNRRDFNGLGRFWSPEVTHHTRSDHRLDNIIAGYARVMLAFPDLRWTIEDMIAEGDKVVTRLTGWCTHQGELRLVGRGGGIVRSVAPTGRPVKCRSVDISRIADGKIVENWGILDELHLMDQLGLVTEGFFMEM